MPTTVTDEKQAPDSAACLRSHEPNEETIAALMESRDIETLPTYDTIQDMLNALGIEC